MGRFKRGLLSLAAAAMTLGGAVACKSQADAPPVPVAEGSPAIAPPAPGDSSKLRVIEAPQGPVGSIVRDALAAARSSGRTLVVYVGATWCEPCQHFHRAAERGELDAAFPRMTLLEFDLDRDRDRLVTAGYVSKYIPLFALPGLDGAASGKQIEGGVKGDGAVGQISARLNEMLSE